MLEIIIAILLSIGVKANPGDIQILSDTSTPGGVEQVTFYDNSNGNSYSMIGTEQSGWGIAPATINPIGTEQSGWGLK